MITAGLDSAVCFREIGQGKPRHCQIRWKPTLCVFDCLKCDQELINCGLFVWLLRKHFSKSGQAKELICLITPPSNLFFPPAPLYCNQRNSESEHTTLLLCHIFFLTMTQLGNICCMYCRWEDSPAKLAILQYKCLQHCCKHFQDSNYRKTDV